MYIMLKFIGINKENEMYGLNKECIICIDKKI